MAAENSTPVRKFTSLDLDGLDPIEIDRAARSPRPVIDYVIPGLVSGSIAVMVGPGGVSKSMLALQTAAVVATGADHWHLWTDGTQPIHSGRVAVFNVEDPKIILNTRVHDIAASMPAHMREDFIDGFHDNVRIWPLAGREFTFGHKTPKTGVIRPSEWIDWMGEQVEGVRLAVIDTFIRGLNGLDENSSTDVAPVLGMLEKVARKTACTFMILHHVNKASNAPGQQAAQQAARGSSALPDNARWQTNLATMSEADAQARGMADVRKRWVQVDLSKCNYGPPLEGRWLYRGEGGVLDGTIQPGPAPQQAAPKAGKVNGHANGHAVPNGRQPPNVPDHIDRKIGW